MSKQIDEKVVSMQFDNKQFERNVKTSINTIDNLKKSLDLKGASKSLDQVNESAKRCDFSHLSNGVETVKSKFSALQVMAITALANITNSAVNAGKQLISSFTIEPIRTGFNEFELKMGSVQTIMSSTGASLETVNKYLNELNEYSDKTIYSFSDMTSNIGKFTNAGVKLEDAVLAIKGISNEAAVSGANAEEASRAMYNFAQALSAGYVKLIDWKSIENANMATVEFKQNLIDTALELGTVVKVGDKYKTTTMDANGKVSELFDSTSMFNDSLAHQWMTTDVLVNTLRDYADETTDIGKKAYAAAQDVKTFSMMMDTLKEAAQSGWAQTWEILVGDFEEGKKLWTNLSEYFGDIIAKSAEKRNSLLEGWKKAGGRDMTIEAIKNSWNGLLSILKPIKEAFKEVFPDITVEKLTKITERIRDLTSKFKLSEDQASKLKSVFKGLFSTIPIAANFIKNLVIGLIEVISRFKVLGSKILDISASLGEWINGLRKTVNETNIFGLAIDKIVNFLDKGISKIKEFLYYIQSKIKAPGVETFLNIMKGIWEFVKKVGSAIGKVFASIGSALGTAFRNGDIKGVIEILNSGIFSAVLLNINKFVKGCKELVTDKTFFERIKDILSGVKSSLIEWQNNIKANIILKIAASMAILVVSLLVLSRIDVDSLSNALAAIGILFIEFGAFLKYFSKLKDSLYSISQAGTAMIKMAAAMLILSFAIKNLSSLSWEELAKGLVGVGVALIGMVGAVRLMPNKKKMSSAATGMILIATAMKIFASAIIDLSGLSWNQLAKGLVGLGVALIGTVGAIRLLPSGKKVISSALGMILLGAAMKIFASAIVELGSMSWENLAKGLLGIGAALIGVIFALRLLPNEKKIISFALGMILIGSALKIFSSAIKDLGNMSWENLAKGLIGIGVALMGVIFAFRLLPNDKKIISSAFGMMLIGVALKIFASAIEDMGSMNLGTLVKGLLGIGVALIGITYAMSLATGGLSGATSILVCVIALNLLIPVLKTLEGISWADLAKGLLAMASTFIIFGIAAKSLAPVANTMIKISIAMALFGAACALIGAGILAISIGLTGLAGSANAIIAAITVVLVGLADLFPTLMYKLGEGIASFFQAIADTISSFGAAIKAIILTVCDILIESCPAIAKAITALVIMLVDVLIKCVPKIVEGILKIVVSVLASLVEYAPKIVNFIFHFLIAVIDTLAKRIPDLIKHLVSMLMALFQGVIDALNTIDPEILVKGILGVGFISALMLALSLLAALAPAAIIGVIAAGVVITELAFVLAGIGKLAEIPGLKELVSGSGGLLMAIGSALGKFIGALAGGIAEGTTSALPGIADNLSSFMEKISTFVEGAKNIDSSMLNGVKSLTEVILLLTAADIMNGIASWLTGGSSIGDFANELIPLGEGLKGFSKEVSGIDVASIYIAAQAGKALAEMADTVPNKGGVASWFAGENSIATFGEEMISLGKGLKSFSTQVRGVDPEAVMAAAEAGKALTAMADTVPNEGGVASWFAGENSIASFGEKLPTLGAGLKSFSDQVRGVDPESVVAAAEAAKALTAMADTVPNEGGVAAWFAGENSIATFGENLPALGKGLKSFSDETQGITPESVIAAAEAAKALTAMADTIPNEGGVVSWFTGDNSIAMFGDELVTLGKGLKSFADETSGIDPVAVQMAAQASKSLTEMASTIPNEGGVVSWFAGDNSVAKFGDELVDLGTGLSSFAEQTSDINPESVKMAAEAAKALADMASVIPNEGGVVAWFAGDNSVAKFGEELPSLGKGLKSFSDEVSGINPVNVLMAAQAGKALAEMANIIPDSGGVVSWFAGDNSVAKFGTQLGLLGEGIANFASNVSGIENIETVKMAAEVGKTIASITETVPTEGGIKAWISGEKSIGKYGTELGQLGEGISDFASEVSGIENIETVKMAADVGKTIASITETAPTEGGIKAWISGEKSIGKYGTELGELGTGIATFAEKVSGIEDVQKAKSAAEVGKIIGSMLQIIPTEGGIKAWLSGEKSLSSFSDELGDLGTGIANFSAETSGINVERVTVAADAAKKIAEMKIPDDLDSLETFGKKLGPLGSAINDFFAKVNVVDSLTITKINNALNEISKLADSNSSININDMAESINGLSDSIKSLCALKASDVKSFSENIREIGKVNADNLVKAFEDIQIDMNDAGKDAITKYVSGVKSQEANAKNAFRGIVDACIEAISGFVIDFKTAGKSVVEGFADGISENSYLAEAEAKTMADDAYKAAKGELEVNSPSKIFRRLAYSVPEGFAMGIAKMSYMAEDSAADMANNAINGTKNAISKIADVINSDVDTQPTIRPILDLSNVTSGAGRINRMLNITPSVGVISNVRSINSMMNELQNGSNNRVVSAIDKLSKKLGNASSNTYNINGITYEEGSDVSDAFKTIIRAAKIERRT